ncbi:MAG TPA: DEAD/DEAH box helicase [Casimicrobium sp.]|nr:DEAD/DEAH box helicase [Casimicrobium sp.]
MSFAALNLAPALLRSIAEKGYVEPTSVQRAAIPAVLTGRDVIASAQTGSGKSAAFALPLLQQIINAPASKRDERTRTRVLVLVPTRELAVQVGETFKGLTTYLTKRIKVSVLFGGVSINPQMMSLRGGADIVVATPGRLLDLIDHNALQISALSTLVLDEADRMLDLGFGDELQRILRMLPAERQSLFFSATFPPAIEALAANLLRDPLRIEVAATEVAKPDISQRAIAVDASARTQLLKHLLLNAEWSRVLVFVATKHASEIVAEKLRRSNIKAEPFHGELSQGKREQVLHDFKAKTIQVVVATDMAARGIDIAQLPVVVNFDLPRSAVDYTHRIGRTGRAGMKGEAVSFITAATEAHFRLIEKRHDMRLPREQIAGFEPTELPVLNVEAAAGTGGIKGVRPSKKDKLRAAAALVQK